MTHSRKSKKHQTPASTPKKNPRKGKLIFLWTMVIFVGALLILYMTHRSSIGDQSSLTVAVHEPPRVKKHVQDKWIERAYAIDELFHLVYTPCWEGAYGAIGDAYLFAAAHDSSLLRFHTVEHDMRKMCTGTWVDDRAWICLAEMQWWNLTGRSNAALVDDAKHRYLEARAEGRLSNAEGFWSWYNYPPSAQVDQRIFTNGAMNQMASVACWLYQATGEKHFLDDALLVWNGDKTAPGIEQTLYKGHGKWEGRQGLAAFGKQLAWEGSEYCSVGAALYRATNDTKYKRIVIETAKRIIDPKNGWVDPQDYYQVQMDGNGAFVNYLLDAYLMAPDDLRELPSKIEKMLEHVWSNHNGTAKVTLHRENDHGIRNGWNPYGGEDGYGVDEVGTVHAQAEAVRAFGMFAYVMNLRTK